MLTLIGLAVCFQVRWPTPSKLQPLERLSLWTYHISSIFNHHRDILRFCFRRFKLKKLPFWVSDTDNWRQSSLWCRTGQHLALECSYLPIWTSLLQAQFDHSKQPTKNRKFPPQNSWLVNLKHQKKSTHFWPTWRKLWLFEATYVSGQSLGFSVASEVPRASVNTMLSAALLQFLGSKMMRLQQGHGYRKWFFSVWGWDVEQILLVKRRT